MLKKAYGRKFSRNTNSRQAMFRSLVKNLILKDSIITTVTKAKAVSPIVDRLFKKVKSGTLADKRSAVALMGNDVETINVLTKKIAEVTSERNSGFTKVTRVERRRGDNSQMVKFELNK